MKEKDFLVLRFIAETRTPITQRLIADTINCSLGIVNSSIVELKKKGYITNNYELTQEGLNVLEPYKVKNAIILAAGMSTRFAPVSYEMPKGLIAVKNEKMVERLIRQLQEAGVNEIVMVVGYMMDKFFYLREKFGVKLVVNNEYATKNTHSSIYAARDYLANTYIVCSDNYYPKNMFHSYEYRAFYCSIYLPGKSYVERGFVLDNDNLVIDTNKPSVDQWIMYGHAYYSQEFTDKFKPILESYYGRPDIDYMYWETIYSENLDELKMWALKCTDEDILEFDSMEELKKFDPEFVTHNQIKIFDNICKILNCHLSEIKDIQPIKKGLNNKSFEFTVNGTCYIYRHPGANAENVIDRHKEAIALRAAKQLKIDDTLIYIDEEEGWKISKFVDVTETFDFANKKHIEMLAKELKVLHDSKKKVGYTFNYRTEADKLIDKKKYFDSISYRKLTDLRDMMTPIFNWLDDDVWQKTLCHNDLYEPNLLVCGDNLELIDWEFAGDSDIGYDICKLFCVTMTPFNEIDEWVKYYFGRPTTEEEKIHMMGCAAVIYYYWYVWGVYASQNGDEVAPYLIPWYDKMHYYAQETLKLLDRNK